MDNKIRKALLDIIQNAINEDFWSEDSLLVDAVNDSTGKQLDCESLSVWEKEEFGKTFIRVDFNQDFGCSIVIQ